MPNPNPTIEMQSPVHESGQVKQIGYHAESQTLAIAFNPRPGNPPLLYHAQNVSAETFESLRTAESPGGFWHKYIKPYPEAFPVHRVVEGVECDCFAKRESPESEVA